MADTVALLAEGVDRNIFLAFLTASAWAVALLAEGVDRNLPPLECLCAALKSPSSRRAWIEIYCAGSRSHGQAVALLAEGVDRNYQETKRKKTQTVALLAEGVDRNLRLKRLHLLPLRRPPRGGRG